jgi:hypothetical protein
MESGVMCLMEPLTNPMQTCVFHIGRDHVIESLAFDRSCSSFGGLCCRNMGSHVQIEFAATSMHSIYVNIVAAGEK